MNKEERMFKSYLARKKRKDAKEIVATIEKRKKADSKNLRKKYKKIKKRQLKKDITWFKNQALYYFKFNSKSSSFRWISILYIYPSHYKPKQSP